MFRKRQVNWGHKEYYGDIAILLLLMVFTFLLYRQTLRAPWYLDDYPNIVNNESIRSFWFSLTQLFTNRGVARLSFSLNFSLFGDSPVSFHAGNILLHGINSFLVYVLLKTFLTKTRFAALAGAVIFLCHPIQSQAVAYIVQRMALLSCFFFLIALFSYGKFRKCAEGDRGVPVKIAWLFLSALAGAFSIYSKENTALFPVVFLVYDWFLSRGENWNLYEGLKRTGLFFLIPGLIVIQRFFLVGSDIPGVSSGSKIPFFLSTETGQFSTIIYDVDYISLKYFMTQCWVLLKYLKLVVLPSDQAFDYCYPLITSFYDPRFIFGIVVLGTVFFAAIYFRNRSPIVTFGVILFFLTIAVESSFIPLDPVFEHRMYLPLVGLIIVFSEGVRHFSSRTGLVLCLAIIAMLSLTTVDRAGLWASPVRLWADNVAKVPDAPRPRVWLARALFDNNRFGEAIDLLEEVMPVYQEKPNLEALVALGESYFFIGRKEDAFRLFRSLQQKYPYENSFEVYSGYTALNAGDYSTANFYLKGAKSRNVNDIRPVFYLGMLYEQEGLYQKALAEYAKAAWKPYHRTYLIEINTDYSTQARLKHQEVIALLKPQLERMKDRVESDPKNLQLRGDYGIVLQEIGAYNEAIEQYLIIQKQAGQVWQLSYNLALIYEIQKEFALAEERFQESLDLNPSNVTVLNSYGVFCKKYGDLEKAQKLFELAVRIDPSFGFALFNLAETHFRLGNRDKARDYFLEVRKWFPELNPTVSEYLMLLRYD